jgi:hypothetical protein
MIGITTEQLQLAADRRTLDSIFLRQPISQRPIGKAQLERFYCFVRADAAALEVFQRFGTCE